MFLKSSNVVPLDNISSSFKWLLDVFDELCTKLSNYSWKEINAESIYRANFDGLKTISIDSTRSISKSKTWKMSLRMGTAERVIDESWETWYAYQGEGILKEPFYYDEGGKLIENMDSIVSMAYSALELKFEKLFPEVFSKYDLTNDILETLVK